ncbi:MAG: acyl carrier protein [Alsobacter sp.]
MNAHSPIDASVSSAVPNGRTDGAIVAVLETFLRTLSPVAKAANLTPGTPLLSSGVLDSLGILQLMGFLGDELGIEIGEDDFTMENFETIGALAAFVARRKAGVAA